MNWTGLAAQAWDPSGGDEKQFDHDFIKRIIESQNGPALDVGCGTGRLLLRYLEAGLTVEGVDTSADMLAICRDKARTRGLPEPVLYQQAMQKLDLPKQYGVIYIPCGTFCLIIDRVEAFEALRRLHAHLEPDGLLVFNLFWPFGDGEALSKKPLGGWTRWGKLWDDTQPDGSLMKQSLMRTSFNRAEQFFTARRRYQLVRDGKVIAEEVFDANERWFYKHEMVMMLEIAGFEDVQVKDGWSDADFAEVHDSMVFIATKK